MADQNFNCEAMAHFAKTVRIQELKLIGRCLLICIKVKPNPASLLLKGHVTNHTTVKQ